ncbi:hypothetical protein PsorP6_007989 [Peronosclerospora sorghi]|uniref:Uncharacterized protein n=1 Tax=Peronosclerospora sorghi TaxID=230839 RepID=A0ACC0W928_9STRA|nr:hypothetical protein PsorP6_007989 [Peronosclerospora sorghi]
MANVGNWSPATPFPTNTWATPDEAKKRHYKSMSGKTGLLWLSNALRNGSIHTRPDKSFCAVAKVETPNHLTGGDVPGHLSNDETSKNASKMGPRCSVHPLILHVDAVVVVACLYAMLTQSLMTSAQARSAPRSPSLFFHSSKHYIHSD